MTGESNGDLRFWDLSTGECIAHEEGAHDDEVVRILLSVDGSRVISFGRNGSIEARNFHDRCELWRIPAEQLPESKLAACSLEASIIAVVTADDEVLVIDGDTGEVLRELSDSEVEGISQVHVVPERFQVLVKYDESDLAAWDLRTILSSASEDYEPDEESELSEDETTEPDEYDLADFWRRGMESADRRVQIGFPCDNGVIYADGVQTTEYGIYGDGTQLQLTANGRVLWWKSHGFMLPGYSNPISGWDVLSQTSSEKLDTVFRDSNIREPTRRIAIDSESGETRIFSCPVQEQEREQRSKGAAKTSDGRIGVAIGVELPSPIFHSLVLPSSESAISSADLRLSPSGRNAVVNLRSQEEPAGWFLWEIQSGHKALVGSSVNSEVVAVTPDWKAIVISEGDGLKVRSVDSNRCLRVLAISGDVLGTPDGRTLVIYSDDGVWLWDLRDSQLFRIPGCPGAQQALVSPDARFLVCSGEEMVYVYDLRRNRQPGAPLLVQPCLNELTVSSHPASPRSESARIECDGVVIIDAQGWTRSYPGVSDIAHTQVHLMLRNLSQFTENIELSIATRK